MQVLKTYERFVGLKINLDESVFLLKRYWSIQQQTKLAATRIVIRTKVKYLKKLFGEVTAEETYAPHPAQALVHAQFTTMLPLSLPKTVQLQQMILPLPIYPARAYFPTKEGSKELANVYGITLWVSSWGLTLPILQLQPKLEWLSLPKPSLYLLW